ncbi:unnamed protein product, partial [Sphacelaria rigidula]
IVLDWGAFPGFREAFNPSEIQWNVDVETIFSFAENISEGAAPNVHGLRPVRLNNDLLLLADKHYSWIARILGFDFDSSRTTTIELQDAIEA